VEAIADAIPGGFSRTAATADMMLQAQLVQRARAVAQLMLRRRLLRKQLRAIETSLRTERGFLRDLASGSNDNGRNVK
jgi:hypothetical protein